MSLERSNMIQLPAVDGSYASGRGMPGLTTPELRERAKQNYYDAERRSGTDALTAHDRMEEFGRDLEILGRIMGEG
jgi:hypothetical protein